MDDQMAYAMAVPRFNDEPVRFAISGLEIRLAYHNMFVFSLLNPVPLL